LEILIDTGASNSVLSPGPALKYFNNYPFKKPFTVKGLHKVVKDDRNVSYPLLSEFGVNQAIDFIVFDWHDRYDGLLGTEDLEKLDAKIDYKTKILQIDNIKIPFVIKLNPLNNCGSTILTSLVFNTFLSFDLAQELQTVEESRSEDVENEDLSEYLTNTEQILDKYWTNTEFLMRGKRSTSVLLTSTVSPSWASRLWQNKHSHGNAVAYINCFALMGKSAMAE
jgi:hypothetical protein